MPIRASRAQAFSAFMEPAQLTQFWLARADGPLREGVSVRWEFKVPGAHVDSKLEAVEVDRKILFAWSDGTTVDLTFGEDESPQGDGYCVVTVVNAGFAGSADEVVAKALDATEGFSIVLCDLKVFLETGGVANLVRDKARLIAATR
jgi:uncharacterized protein YndB with AHSA1/START domain